MTSDTVQVTLQLTREQAEFAERFAREHGMTVTELIDRYLARVQTQAEAPLEGISETVLALTGILPPIDDPEGEYRDHLERKHR